MKNEILIGTEKYRVLPSNRTSLVYCESNETPLKRYRDETPENTCLN